MSLYFLRSVTLIVSLLIITGCNSDEEDSATVKSSESGAIGSTFLECSADFKAMPNGGNRLVKLVQNTATTYEAYINDLKINDQVAVREYPINRNLDYNQDPYDANAPTLNEGETALIHAHGLRAALGNDKVNIPFDLSQVNTAKIFDLAGNSNTNKFGGTVLIGAYDADGNLLGYLLRSLFVNACIEGATNDETEENVLLKCTAEFKYSQGSPDMQIKLIQNEDSTIAAFINGMKYSDAVKVSDYTIRDNLDFGRDPDEDISPEINFGEMSLTYIYGFNKILNEDPDYKKSEFKIKIPFELKEAKTVKVYDLDGNSDTNKFGGTVLTEAFDSDGTLLGRIFRSILVNGCN